MEDNDDGDGDGDSVADDEDAEIFGSELGSQIDPQEDEEDVDDDLDGSASMEAGKFSTLSELSVKSYRARLRTTPPSSDRYEPEYGRGAQGKMARKRFLCAFV